MTREEYEMLYGIDPGTPPFLQGAGQRYTFGNQGEQYAPTQPSLYRTDTAYTGGQGSSSLKRDMPVQTAWPIQNPFQPSQEEYNRGLYDLYPDQDPQMSYWTNPETGQRELVSDTDPRLSQQRRGNRLRDVFNTPEGGGQVMSPYMPFFAGSVGYNVNKLGEALGTAPGTRGRGANIAMTASLTGLSGAREFLSGYGTGKSDQRVMSDALRNRDALGRVYTSDRRTYQDPNSRSYRYGGLFNFEGGGQIPADMTEEEMMIMQQMQQQSQQMPPEGEQQMQAEDEVVQLAQQLTEQFQGDINQIQNFLEQEGADPQIIEQILMIVQQMLQEGQMEQQQEELPASSVMRNTMERRMDTPIEFRRGGTKKYPKLY